MPFRARGHTSSCFFVLPSCFSVQLRQNTETKRPSVGVLGGHRGTFCVLPSLPEVFRSQAVQAGLLLCLFPCFPKPLDSQEFLEHAIAISVGSVAAQEGILDREGKPSRLLDVRVLLFRD